MVKNTSHSHLNLVPFLKKYHYQEWFIDSPLPDSMRKELTVRWLATFGAKRETRLLVLRCQWRSSAQTCSTE